jgi:hypothetical protein
LLILTFGILFVALAFVMIGTLSLRGSRAQRGIAGKPDSKNRVPESPSLVRDQTHNKKTA